MGTNTISFSGSGLRILISDICILALVYLIPAFSHLIAFPVYLLDPMRVLLLTVYLVSRNNTNTYILALTIPLFSMLVSGHPVFFKALLISIELFINVWLFVYLLKISVVKNQKWAVPAALFTSILVSKLIYYGFKYVFISSFLLEGSLVSTGLLTQLIIALVITLVFSFIYLKLGSSNKANPSQNVGTS